MLAKRLSPGIQRRQLQYFDVRLHGRAVGDGVADDTAAIQRAFDSTLPIYFPPGKYRITSTVTQWTGGVGSRGRIIEGASVTFHPPTMPRVTGSWLIWDGPVDGIMLDTTGATGNEFSDLTFVGRPTTGAANKVGAFIKTKNSTAPADGSQLAVLNSIASNTSGISAASIISVQTANPGTGWVTFPSTAGDTLDIQNSTGTDIEYRLGGAGSAIRIPDGFGREVDIVANANEIQVRRVDQTNTQVTVVAEATV